MFWFLRCLFVEIVVAVGVFRFVFLLVFYDYVYALRVLPAETRLAVYRRLRVSFREVSGAKSKISDSSTCDTSASTCPREVGNIDVSNLNFLEFYYVSGTSRFKSPMKIPQGTWESTLQLI